MQHLDPKNLTIPEIHQLLIGGVGPRPIALVSTLSGDGIPNLAPFSYFNAFGANPPTIAFSPGRRGKDGTLKDTYNNLVKTRECVVQVVTHAMVEQINLSSADFPPTVDEFVKSGLTPVDSLKVKPQRVKESPIQLECILKEMIALGEGKASGNLAICEIVYFHLAEGILVNGVIHPDRLDLVGRMGGDYYARASGKAIFRVEKPVGAECLGYEGLPAFIKKSHIFSANNLARFANSKTIPTKEAVRKFLEEFRALPEEDVSEADFLRCLRQQDYSTMLRITQALAKEKHPKVRTFAEYTAKCALENNNLDFAWMAALYSEMIA